MMDVRRLLDRIVKNALAPFFLGMCILLGGSSTGGVVANAALQLLAVFVIVLLATRNALIVPPPAAGLVLIGLLTAGLMLLQLIPLPPLLWEQFPARGVVANGYRLAGMQPPWLPISLVPDGTIAALLSLLPVAAMFLATLAASAAGRRGAVYLIVVAAACSILLGAFQRLRAFGYFYAVTSYGAVGFFSNRNHLATLCLMALPFASAMAVSRLGTVFDRKVARRIIAASAVGLLAAGVLVAQSIAGWILLAPTLIGGMLVYQRGQRGSISRGMAWMAGGALAAGIALAVVASFTIGDLGQQVAGVRPIARRQIMALSAQAAAAHFPLGSGFGSFPDVYPRYEALSDVSGVYVNHAHDEYIELTLEAGLPGVLLLAGFLVWWVVRLRAIWRPDSAFGSFSRAASLAIAVPLAHSFVDYPLRTAAIAAVTAMACAMLASADPERPRRAPAAARSRGNRTGMIMLAPDPPGAPAVPASDRSKLMR